MADVQPSVKLYLAAFAALLGALSMGLCLGYTAAAFISMEQDNCPNYDCQKANQTSNNSTIFSDDPTVKDNEKSNLASALAIGGLLGGLLGEPCSSYLGRRRSLILYGIPFTLAWLLIGFANSLWMIIAGRLLGGLSCGLVSQTAPTYVVEISPPKIRGFLGTCFQVMVTIGFLFIPTFALFAYWKAMALISVIPAIAMSVAMIIMPDSPVWLLSKGMSVEAEAALKQLRTDNITSEFANMTRTIAGQTDHNSKGSYSLAVFKSKEFLIPTGLALGLMFFQQFSGVNAILFFQGDIFKVVTPSLPALIATISVCIAQVIATVIGSLLVDRLGRRALLLVSGLGHTVALVIFGSYKHYSETNELFETQYAWLALTSIIIFISSFSVGYGPIPWMMVPEITSSRVRSIISSISTAFNWLCVYIVTKTAKPVASSLGYDVLFWMYAFVCALSCVFVYFLLPETKGRTENDIQAELVGAAQNNAVLSASA